MSKLTYFAVSSIIKDFCIKFKHCFFNSRSFQGENHFQGVFKDLAVFKGVFQARANHAFTKVGVDFDGPLYVKNIYQAGGEMYKCYIALFTCASTKAIHLELTPDLSANSFIRVLKRFIGRRGFPGQRSENRVHSRV